MTLIMTLNHQNNTFKWIFQSKDHEKKVIHIFLALFVKTYIFSFDLEIDLLTLKMNLNDKNIFPEWIAQSKAHGNEVLHLFLASFLDKSYLTLRLTFDLESTKMLKLFKLALIGFEFSTIYKKHQKNIV